MECIWLGTIIRRSGWICPLWVKRALLAHNSLPPAKSPWAKFWSRRRASEAAQWSTDHTGYTGQRPVMSVCVNVLSSFEAEAEVMKSMMSFASDNFLTLYTSSLPSYAQWPLMSAQVQVDCNYQTEGTSRLINMLTSSSHPTRAYSTAKPGSDNFIPHLSPCTHVHLCMYVCICICMCASLYHRAHPRPSRAVVNRDVDEQQQS